MESTLEREMPGPILDPNQVDDTLNQPVISPEQDQGTSAYQPGIAPPVTGLNASYAGPTDRGQKRAQGMPGQIDQRIAGYEAKDAISTQNEIGQYQRSVEGQKAAIEGVKDVNTDYENQ